MIFYNRDSLNVLLVFLIVIELILGALTFWAVLFSSYYLGFLCFITMVIIVPVKLQSYILGLCRVGAFLLFLLLVVLTYKIPTKEINSTIQELSSKLSYGKDSSQNFSYREKAGLYGLHFLMSLCAFPIYPEASKEALYMHLPNKKNKRIFPLSDIPQSKIIKSRIEEIEQNLSDKSDDITIPPQTVTWPAEFFKITQREARYAFAFNPCTISGVSVKAGKKRLTTWTLTVSCNYSHKHKTTLLQNPPLIIEQGLYRMLQDSGWLHGYEAQWKFRTIK